MTRQPNKRGRKKQPVIAILTISDQNRPLRGNLYNFADLIRTGNELGALVYVTTAEDLKLSDKKIKGHSYNHAQKEWSEKHFPLPDVIYNRIPYRKYELQPDVQKTIQSCLKDQRIHLFNPSFFNKWTLFEWLSAINSTKKYIPKTEKLINHYNLISLFDEYPTLYLKPVRGKAGRGIMRVEKQQGTGNEQYRLIYHHNNKRELRRYNDVQILWAKIKNVIGNRDYIAQQGIALARFNKRPFDLRVLVQKNSKGLWSLTGIGARVAGKLSITTHVPRGGSIDDPQKLLVSRFGHIRAARIMKQAERAAHTIAKQIEQSSDQKMGEMSMDLGVDRSGNLWFFEANSKPMKFDEPDIRKKSLERIIRYCIYLSKQNNRQSPGNSVS